MSKLLSHPEALVNTVQRLALEAGDITLQYYDETGFQGAEEKGDGSPVTLADREAEAHIIKGLKDITPDIPIVGEESHHLLENIDLSTQEYFWLVDPLDGTREFVSGGPEYTVNIALIRNGEPIMGVIAAPVKGEVYLGHVEYGAARWLEETDVLKEIRVRSVPRTGYTAIVSKNRGDGPEMKDYLAKFKIEKVLRRSSSLKICAIALGKADLYPNFGITCEWDLAAGHAILKAAGGNIFDLKGEVLSYGHLSRGFKNPDFIAAAEFPEV